MINVMRCIKCGQEKAVQLFRPKRRSCRKCEAAITRKYYSENKPKAIAATRRWERNHPDKKLAQGKRWHQRHRDEHAARLRCNYWKNPEKQREDKRLWNATHKEYKKSAAREYYLGHTQRLKKLNHEWRTQNARLMRDYRRRWKLKNPDAVKHIVFRRRVRKIGNGPIERISLSEIAFRDGNRCHICHLRVSLKDRSLDHLIPIAHGGPHVKSNVALAHRLCNAKRGVGRYIPAQLRLLG